MSVKHIATTIQAARNMFSDESVQTVIAEAEKVADATGFTVRDLLLNASRTAADCAKRFEDDAAKARKVEIRNGWIGAAELARDAADTFYAHAIPPVSDDELRSLIAEDWRKTAGRYRAFGDY